MRRAAATLAVVAAVIVLAAAPATATPSFDPPTLAAGQHAQLALRVPVEGRGTNLRVIVHLMQGFLVDNCATADGWRCRIVLAKQPSRTILTFEWAQPAVPPSSDIVHFALKAPTSGAAFRIEVDQFYVDGHVVYWGGSVNKPAPTLTLVGGAAPTTAGVPAATTTTVALTPPHKHGPNWAAAAVAFALMLCVVVPVCVEGNRPPPGH